ncbi:very short patch repair endonuclease [Dactylosporangium sp. CA-233914]|uniref:very short patch repair endonuclease n=1 Tax=Dactylosporangium sp. CA-233914 TaxID=3239934 RepID=UPI003D8A9517
MTDDERTPRRISGEPRPPASSEVVRTRMRQQVRSHTAPEVAARHALHVRGIRYRLHVPVPGLPRRSIDICFAGRKVAVFIDGCFWHGCPVHATAPKSNAAWWRAKLVANRQRDTDTTAHLEKLGWLVLRFWAHESPETIANHVQDVICAVDMANVKMRTAGGS